MTLTHSQQLLRWGIVLAIFIIVLWMLGGVVTPYLIAMALAYFLDPIADRLEARGLSRTLSVVIITLIAMIVATLVFILIAPLIVEQLFALIQSLPEKGQKLEQFVSNRFPQIQFDASVLFDRFQAALQKIGTYLLDTIINSTKTIFGFVALIVIVPVVTFYILLDWDDLVSTVDGWLPRDHRKTIHKIVKDIDTTLAGFIRGQGTVCLIMAIYYSTVLSLVGLDYGMIIGVIAGLLAFIPYIGAFIGAALAIGFGLYQFWGDWSHLALLVAVYFGGQSIEGNVITPRLVGQSVGLHPVWLMFALSVFGSLLGLPGMLIAVPVAASIGVVGRYFISQYKNGRLYLGQDYLNHKKEEVESE